MSGVKLKLKPMDELTEVAGEIRVLSHPVRLQMLGILSQRELSARIMSGICNVSEPVTSDHLLILKRGGILESERRGKSIYYRIKTIPKPEFLKHLNMLFSEKTSE